MNIMISLFLLLLVSTAAVANENPYTAYLFYQKGDVKLSADGGLFGTVEKGESLSVGDVIKTGKSSLAIVRFPDKSTMRIDHNSEIKIADLVERVEETSLGSTSIILRGGRAVIDVINNSKSPVFNVRTKAVSVGVRGTRFMTGLDPESGHMDLAVDRGEVHIAHNDKEGVEDAIEAGHSIHLENGSEFNQPQKHDWIKKFNFNANDKEVDHNKMKKVMDLKRLEHKEKRKKWMRDALRWKTKKQKWAKLKSKHLERAKRLKGKRMEFLKKKKSFLLKRNRLVQKRESLLKERGQILSELKSLKKEKLELAKSAKAYRSGRKDPRKKMELLRKKQALNLKSKNLRSRVGKLKKKKSSLVNERKGLIDSLKGTQIGKNLKGLKKRKIEEEKERQKNKAKKKMFKKARKKMGLPGGLFGN